MLAYATALADNKGLVELCFPSEVGVSDWNTENWAILCESLKKHGKLETFMVGSNRRTGTVAVIAERTRQLADALHFNTVIRCVMPDDYDETVYRQRIAPRLEMNKAEFEDQRKALVKVENSLLRAKLLGRALHTVQYHDLGGVVLRQ